MQEKLENYYYFVCSDSSKEGAEDLFIQTVNNDGFEKYKSGRFLYLNAWRNISGKWERSVNLKNYSINERKISALASKKRSNQTKYYYNNQGLFNIIKCLYFLFNHSLKSADLRDVAIQKKSSFQE